MSSAPPHAIDSDLFIPALEGKRLYLMRHGKSYEPRLDTPAAPAERDPQLPLTEEGRRGVEATARALAHLRLEAAYASTFLRSCDTARIVALPHAVGVETRPEFEELRVYPEEGGDMRAVARRYIRLARELARCPAHEVVVDEAGRSIGSILDAAWTALGECLDDPPERVLLVAHGGLNRLLLTRMLGLPLHRFLSLDQDFACVNVIEFGRRGRPWVRALNVTVDDPFKAGEGRV